METITFTKEEYIKHIKKVAGELNLVHTQFAQEQADKMFQGVENTKMEVGKTYSVSQADNEYQTYFDETEVLTNG